MSGLKEVDVLWLDQLLKRVEGRALAEAMITVFYSRMKRNKEDLFIKRVLQKCHAQDLLSCVEKRWSDPYFVQQLRADLQSFRVS